MNQVVTENHPDHPNPPRVKIFLTFTPITLITPHPPLGGWVSGGVNRGDFVQCGILGL